ncbi:MAG TPA: C45 family autoproteolytic acyltransferase/hydrolase [Holophaga sp.]|nr:C45 family autoproteolytic acyltransferase/hydrolase [Holophaga sp.]
MPLRGLAFLLAVLPALAGLSPEQEALARKGYRKEKAGWIFLHVEGSPRARGLQHGWLLAKEIDRGLKAVKLSWEHQTGTTWDSMLEKAKAFFVPGVDAELLEELEGMAEGLKAAGVATTRDELACYNGSSELLGYWWPVELARLRNEPVAPHKVKESCSAFVAVGSWTKDGGIVMGHNNMSSYQEPLTNIVLDLAPEKGHRILMQGVPGWIHSGTDFFLTDAGLAGTETTIGDFQPYEPGGSPVFSRMRTASQRAGDIEGWCALMRKGNNGGIANAWLLADARRKVIARLELGLRFVGFETKTDGWFSGSNIAEDKRILRFETTTKDTDVTTSKVARRLRWRELLASHRGRIDVEAAKAFEADHRDVARNAERAGGRSLCAHFDLETEIPGEVPWDPSGTTDAKVLDGAMVLRMSFAGRFGSACGTAFDAKAFLEAHPQFDWLGDTLPSRPSQPWVVFTAGE